MPMNKVADKFNVSGSYMARVCSMLQVPHPVRGYWAKLAVEKAHQRPPLPAAQPGDQLNWSQGGESGLPIVPRISTASRNRVRSGSSRSVTGTHGLIREAIRHYDAGHKVEEGQHLRPHKRLLVDITASRGGLDKALGFANDLFNALESAGHRVLVSSPAEHFIRARIDEHEQVPKVERKERHPEYSHLWSPQRPTVVYVGSVALGLAIIEMSESVLLRYVNGRYVRESDYKPLKASARYFDHSWTTTKDIPCSRLRLVVYAPYSGVSWSVLFQESKDRALTQDIPKIVESIENSTDVLAEKVKEEERQAELRRQEWEVRQERWRNEEDTRRVAQSIKESREQLVKVIEEWAKVVSVEQFFESVQRRVQSLPDKPRQDVLQRLTLAREFLGTDDPLDFFRSWKTPVERYVPLSIQMSGSSREEQKD